MERLAYVRRAQVIAMTILIIIADRMLQPLNVLMGRLYSVCQEEMTASLTLQSIAMTRILLALN
jgi:hypothetical protein